MASNKMDSYPSEDNRGIGQERRIQELIYRLEEYACKTYYDHQSQEIALYLSDIADQVQKTHKGKFHRTVNKDYFKESKTGSLEDVADIVDGMWNITATEDMTLALKMDIQAQAINFISTEATRLEKEPIEIYPDLGRLYFSYGMKEYAFSTENNKSQEETHRRFRGALLLAKDHIETAQDKGLGIDTQETLSDIAHNLGVIEINEKKYERAEKFFNYAVENDPENSQKIFSLLLCEGVLGNKQAIDKQVKKMWGSDEQAEMLTNIATTLIHDYERVETGTYVMEKAADMAPRNYKAVSSMAHLNLTRARRTSDIKQGRHEEFLDKAQRNVKALRLIHGDSPQIDMLKADIKIEEKDYDGAKEILTKYAENTSEPMAEAQYKLSKVFVQESKVSGKEAVSLQKALELAIKAKRNAQELEEEAETQSEKAYLSSLKNAAYHRRELIEAVFGKNILDKPEELEKPKEPEKTKNVYKKISYKEIRGTAVADSNQVPSHWSLPVIFS